MLLKLDSGTAGAGETAADTRERSQAILDQVVVDLTAVVDGTFDDGRALPERLAQLVERWQGLAVVSLTGDERAFDAVTDLSALRIWIFEIVEEGIYNAVTRGCATHIDVHIAVESDAIEVNVRDDGIGVRIDAEQGLGLSAIGRSPARLTLRSLPRGGCQFWVTIPLSAEALGYYAPPSVPVPGGFSRYAIWHQNGYITVADGSCWNINLGRTANNVGTISFNQVTPGSLCAS